MAKKRFKTSLEILEKLVSFKTVSKDSNLELIEFVEEYFKSYGLESYRVYDKTREKAAIYTHIGPKNKGGIILSGHSDVVPVEGQDWETDPFKLTKKEDKFYGRGACDMKGFIACALSAVPEMLEADLLKPIQIAISYDEEVGCLGAPHMIKDMQKNIPPADLVIVGEPTMMKVVNSHKGISLLETEIRGFEVHSSLVNKGVSAVMTAAQLINWLEVEMRKNSDNSKKNSNALAAPFNPPYTTLHVGKISGGTASNITAKNCTFSTDIRVVPGESLQEWIRKYKDEVERVEKIIKSVNQDSFINVNIKSATPGCRPESEGIAEQLARSITGDNTVNVVSYGTEGGQFQEAGYSAIICGPGNIEQAHQPNEFISLSQIKRGEAFIKEILSRQSN